MLSTLLHRAASHPWCYEQIQRLAGAKHLRRQLARQAWPLKAATVLDLGGGTGLYRDIWSPECVYVCLDIDALKLRGFHQRHPMHSAIMADAVCVPVASHTFDAVVCTAVSHHLTDEAFEQLVAESARVLNKNGTFIFLDAVWAPARWAGRLLWQYDRGSYPRSVEHIWELITKYYQVVHHEPLTIFHEYFLCVGHQPTLYPAVV